MRRFVTLISIVGVLGCCEKSGAQDIHFSQFYENAILRNPALTGIFSGDYRAGVNYRNQWSNISTPFQTMLATAETRILINEDVGDYLSFGIAATYDKAGTISFNSFQVYPAINYNKSLEDEHQSYLSMGFTAGYIQRSVDPTKMTFASQYQGGSYNPANPSGELITNTRLSYLDVGAGLSFNSSIGEFNQVNYYVGASVYHLNRPKAAFNKSDAFIRTDMKWNGSLGLHYSVNDEVGITSHFNFVQQGRYREIIAGGLVGWKRIEPGMKTLFTIYGGLFYRVNDAIIPTVKLDFRSYSFTVSYDINTSALRAATNSMGGMEISVFARGFITKGRWAQDKTKCPRFEQMILPTFQ